MATQTIVTTRTYRKRKDTNSELGNKIRDVMENTFINPTKRLRQSLTGKVEETKPMQINPFLNEDGSLKYNIPDDVYQSMIDNGSNQQVKDWVSQATGLSETPKQVTEYPISDSDYDGSFPSNSSGNVTVNTTSSDGVFKNKELLGYIAKASRATGVPTNILLSVAQQESGGKWYDAVPDGTAYSHGYMMLYDNGALAGLSPEMKQKAKTDPYTNVLVGAQLLADNYKRYGSWQKALARYNGSGAAAERYGATTWARANSEAYKNAMTGNTAARTQAGGTKKSTGNRLADVAQRWMGTPYVWGGSSSKDGGLDCSGFVYQALNGAGYKVGRTTAQGYRQYGQRVSTNDLRPGDLLFFGSPSNASHIGIYIGNGKMIHSSGGSRNTRSNPGKGVSIQNVNYRRDLVEARRL